MQALHITGGQDLSEYLQPYFKEEKFTAFNEAMIDGHPVGDLFSPKFCMERSKTHGVSVDDYKKITIEPLEEALKEEWEEIHLWFDNDMFCQVNTVTLLAYLEKVGHKENVSLHTLCRGYWKKELEQALLSQQSIELGYYQFYYDRIICKHNWQLDLSRLPIVIQDGLELFKTYLEPDNELVQYLRGDGQEVSMGTLMKKFSQYGLGDVQVKRLKERVQAENKTE